MKTKKVYNYIDVFKGIVKSTIKTKSFKISHGGGVGGSLYDRYGEIVGKTNLGGVSFLKIKLINGEVIEVNLNMIVSITDVIIVELSYPNTEVKHEYYVGNAEHEFKGCTTKPDDRNTWISMKQININVFII